MRHLIIGAGASLAESINAGYSIEDGMPLISNFARKTWGNYNPHPYLEEFLNSIGQGGFGRDARDLFYELESSGVTNVEHFFEFVWRNRNQNFPVRPDSLPSGYIHGLRLGEAGSNTVTFNSGPVVSFWENMLYHGIGHPMAFAMLEIFHENGKGWKDLCVSKTVAGCLRNNDLVLNLNYDTIFEIALSQLGVDFQYVPNKKTGKIRVCKPHGSLNMVANDSLFTFGQPEWLGTPETKGFKSFSGFVPPRLNKSYEQHQIAKTIINSVISRRPNILTFWGVGLTKSDIDLLHLYKNWGQKCKSIEVINVDKGVACAVRELLDADVSYFTSVEEWEKKNT